MLHVFGKTVDTCLENKYKYGLAIVHLSKIKSKQKLMKNNSFVNYVTLPISFAN